MSSDFAPKKAAENDAKHGVSFAEVEAVLYDPVGLTREDEEADGEARFVTIGLGALGRIPVLVWTERSDDYRLISARVATSTERNRYEG
jgi:uncharacterized DUF497 family protein